MAYESKSNDEVLVKQTPIHLFAVQVIIHAIVFSIELSWAKGQDLDIQTTDYRYQATVIAMLRAPSNLAGMDLSCMGPA